jgi:hypothetical protein
MNDSTLKFLTLSHKTTFFNLNPTFHSAVKSYSCCVESSSSEILIKAIPSQSDGFAQVQKCNKQGTITCSTGNTLVEIRVEAPDGSFSIVTIDVYRPGPSEMGLASISLLSPLKTSPAFSRNERNYIVECSLDADQVGVSIVPLNDACSVQSQSQPITLHVGDSLFQWKVTSQDLKGCCEYSITARKPFLPWRPQSGSRLTCNLCHSFLSRPRKNLFKCNHIFCFVCLELLCDLKIVGPTTLWICPIDGNTSDVNPSIHSDQDVEYLISMEKTSCPFIGCLEKDLTVGNLSKHIQVCLFKIQSVCGECYMRLDATGVHHTDCTTTCIKCNKKYGVMNKSIHESVCGLVLPTFMRLSSISEWEKRVGQTAKGAFTTEKVKVALEKANKDVERAWTDSKMNLGRTAITLSVAELDTAAALLCQAIHQDIDSSNVKKIPGNDVLHFNLAQVLQAIHWTQHCFPEIKKEVTIKVNENDAAKDSFMADEVDGLLLQIGRNSISTKEFHQRPVMKRN